MRELPEKNQHFFNLLEKPSQANDKRKINHSGYFMAIDAEWFESEGHNVVLSYQIATCSRHHANNIIKYVPHGKRLKLAEIIELGIRSVHDGGMPEVCPDGTIRVVLVAHNFAAEWSVLADRDADYITKRLSLIRKTPVTDGHAIKLRIENKPVEVKIYDTMLLAPVTHRSLAKLSSLLGKKYKGKMSIKQSRIEHMDRYLREDPVGFEKYALRDSEVCLKLFFVLQQALNELAFGADRLDKLFRTLASAAVSGFTSKEENEWFKEYLLVLGLAKPTKKQKEQLKKHPNAKIFPGAYRLVKRAYFGGRNESYFVGHTGRYAETRGRVWIDIDLSSAYPSSMALCPLIDLNGEIRQTHLRYRLDKKCAKRLEKDGIPPATIRSAQQALAESPAAFDKILYEEIRRSHARQIRYRATAIDNSLIERWQQLTSSTAEWNPEHYVIPGFARVRFNFPAHILYPCIPVKHPRYGLIYPRQGETVTTAPEILLALSAGATIDALASVELPVSTEAPDGKSHETGPYCFFMKHLRVALTERAKYKKQKGDANAQIYEKLLKEFINSFYGKFSQSINPRNMYSPSTGEMNSLGPSTLTEPSVASLTTGQTRAVLSALLIAIDNYNRGKPHPEQVSVISATTDGLLIGVSCDKDYSLEDDYYVRRKGIPILKSELEQEDKDAEKMDLQKLFSKFGHDGLLASFAQELPIRQLIHSRQELTGSDEYLEVKHLVDEVVSVKTRGQIGLLNSGEAPLLARFGHKPPLSELIEDPEEYKRVMEAGGVVRNTEDSKWIQGQLTRIENGLEKINSYTFITLTNFRKMLESEGRVDLVKQTRQQKINCDYDWKRKIVSADSPFTKPYQDLDEMLIYRRQMETIRRSGRVARPEQVLHRVCLKQKVTTFRDGDTVTLARQFIRGVVQQHLPLESKQTYLQMTDHLNRVWQQEGLDLSTTKEWRIADLKNAKRRHWEPGVLLPTLPMTQLLKVLCRSFGVDEELATRLLFIAPEYRDENAAQVKEMVRAVLHAPKDGIEPFCELFHKGQLPDKTSLLAVLRPVLTEAMLTECVTSNFMPASRYSSERPNFIKLFRRIGLTRKDAENCARVLAPPAAKSSTPRRNPGQKRCLDHFVMALQLPDIQSLGLKPTFIIERLTSYGLSRSRYYALRKNRLTPYSLTDTPANQKQIARMAKSLRLDSTPYLDLLIDK